MDVLGLTSEQASELDSSEEGRARFAALLESTVITTPETLDQALLEAVGDKLSALAGMLLSAGARPQARWGPKAATLLQLACARNDAATAAALLAGGAARDECDAQGGTAVHYASAAGAAALLPLLLADAGSACLNAQDKAGATPLCLAAFLGQDEAVKALLAAGADCGLRSAAGRTALHYAAQGGSADCLRLLLAAGCEVDCATGAGATALACAAQEGHCSCVEALLAAGASPGSQDELGCTPLAAATLRRRGDAAALLLPVTPAELRTAHGGLTAMHVAVAGGDASLLRAVALQYPSLLDELSAPMTEAANPRGELGVAETALHMAAGGNDSLCAASLLACGASPAARDGRGRTPLHVAAEVGADACVAALLASAGEAEAAAAYCGLLDGEGKTALAAAAAAGKAGAVRRLLRAGAAVAAGEEEVVARLSAFGIAEEEEEEEGLVIG